MYFRMKRHRFNFQLIFVSVVLVFAYGLTGCSSVPSPNHPPPSPGGSLVQSKVYVTRTDHAAAAETNQSPLSLLEIAENYLREYYKVTFINRSLFQIEAENKTVFIAFKITPLTSGGTGLWIKVMNREDHQSKPNLACDIAKDILDRTISTAKK